MNEKLNGLSNRLCVENDCGQWSASYSGYGTSCYQGLKSEDGSIVALAVAHDSEPFGDPDTRENVRRLAACWNACEGISTDDLEAGVLEKLKNDRVQLLCALQALGSAFISHTQWNGEPPAEILQARAAINKALGVES